MKSAFAAMGVIALALGGTAFAGPPSEPKVTFGADGAYTLSEAFLMEMACVQDHMTQRMWDDYGAVLVLNGDNPVSKKAAAEALEDCVSQYLWSDEERALADQMAQNTAIWDFQNLDMFLAHVTPENLEAAWMSLSVADRRAFLADGWGEDTAFRGRVTAALRANGVRNNEEQLMTAAIALGAYSFIAETRETWARRYRK